MGRLTGAQAVCLALERLGVRHVFAYPGSEITDLLEGLRASAIRTVVPTSELAGTFAAAGYARASGEVGVVAVIPGPGLAYALPGIAEARYDSLPLLVLTGVNDPYAPFDLGDAMRPVAKDVLEPDSADELAPVLVAAHALAAAGEPGPVVIRLPPVALAAPAAASPAPALSDPPLPAEDVAEVARRLAAATRVTMLLGQGATGASAEALALAELLGGAVLATTSGRGTVPESHERSLVADVPGRGAEQVNRLLADSDVVLAIGCRFNRNATLGDRLRFDAERLIRVDTSLREEPAAALSIEADARTFLRALLAELPAAARNGWEPAELERRRRELARAIEPASRTDPRLVGTAESSPEAFFADLRRALPEEGVLAVDSGLHQQLARRYFRVLRPRTFLLPTDFQSMGFALPAAIGAALARPERPVVALLGDGGLAMSGLELLTAAREGIPLTVVVLNDGRLNLIRMQQLLRFGREHGVTLAPPDIEALARATGARYVRVSGEAEPILSESIGSGELRLLEVVMEDSTLLRHAGTLGSLKRAARRGRSLLGR